MKRVMYALVFGLLVGAAVFATAHSTSQRDTEIAMVPMSMIDGLVDRFERNPGAAHWTRERREKVANSMIDEAVMDRNRDDTKVDLRHWNDLAREIGGDPDPDPAMWIREIHACIVDK